MEEKIVKTLAFEIFAAGFQACINGETLAAAYEKFYKEITNYAYQ